MMIKKPIPWHLATKILFAALLLLALTACILPATATSVEKIAFDSSMNGNWEIYVMNPDGSGQTCLTNNPAWDSAPAWSPDGTKIAFESDRDGNYETDCEIYVMNPDGSEQTRLTYNTAFDSAPAWSPDGTKIAFASDRDGNWEIYVMNADGSEQTRLTYDASADSLPSWSPDGSKIAFVSDKDGGGWSNYEIYVMNADGSGQTRITNNEVCDRYPSWSPDGSKIAFVSYRDGNYEIYVMNADGSGQTRITDNPAEDDYAPPAWSPDGSKIAFVSNRDVEWEIYVMNADGSGQTRITDNQAQDSWPKWVKIPDTTPPTTLLLVDVAWTNGWYNCDPLIQFVPQDPDDDPNAVSTYYTLDGVSYVYTDVFYVKGDGEHTLTYYSVDPAGNVGPEETFIIRIDTVKPTVSVSTPLDGATYTLDQTVTADWSVTDDRSGIDTATGTYESGKAIDTSSVGSKEFTVTATDTAGNTITVTYHYTVAYAYTPVTPSYSAKMTQMKLGSSLPIKVVLRDSNGNLITDATVQLYLAKWTGSDWDPNEIKASSLSNPKDSNAFRYDSLTGQYVYNLDTKPLSTGTWELRIKMDDSTMQAMTIQIVK